MLAATSTFANATPASAFYQPDGRIGLPCHRELEDCQMEWFGDDIYSTRASDQRAVYVDYPNFYDVVTVTFKIRIQNDGNRSDGFLVAATGTTAGYRVRFFVGSTDVTASIKAGTLRTPWLLPGDSYLIKAKVKPHDPKGGDKTNRVIKLASRTDPTKVDTVKLVRTYSDMVCGC
jgi:hypothetical protein